MILISHPTGNANVRAVMSALDEAEKLTLFQTTIASQDSDWYLSLVPRTLREQLLRRRYNIASDKLRTRPLREVVRLLAQKVRLSIITKHETGWASVDSIYRDLDFYVSQQLPSLIHQHSVSAVYSYEDGALETFKSAKQLGLKCIYDLPIGYWRLAQKIQEEEAELKPEWAGTLTAILDSPQKLSRKDSELGLADSIIVASSFTKNSLALASEITAPIYVIPYGAPLVERQRVPNKSNVKLKVVFVGSLGQRKGISYLLEAVKKLDNLVELTLIGRPSGECTPLAHALQKYRWIPSLPHSKVLEEMSHHDVFVFPSLLEGFGLVLLEAMSQGLPVITTSHTAGPDIITEGKDGFIVPVRSSEAIAEKLELLANDRDLLHSMSFAAQAKSSMFTWESYKKNILEVVNKNVPTLIQK